MSTDPKFLWLGEKHKEALAILKYGIFENKGVLALTGDVGTGKTTLINALVKDLGKDIIVATIYDPGLEPLEFFNIVGVAFNMGASVKDKGQFLIHFKKFLQKARKQNRKVLLIIDEAQRIGPELLEEVRLLSNLEAEHVRLLNIFFIGQNEFVDIVQEDVNRALRQRIAISYVINPLTIEETAAYVNHRLRIAGAKTPIFARDAVQEIFAFSGGYPRLINILCDHALLSGFVKGVQSINVRIIRECQKELQVSKWIPGHCKDVEEEAVREEQKQDHVSETYEDQDDEQDAIQLARGLYQEAPVTKRDKMPIGLAVLSVVLIFLIAGLGGYVYYNYEKIKLRIPGMLSLKKDSASYKKPSDSGKDKEYLVPFIPQAKDKEPLQKAESTAAPVEAKARVADKSLAKDLPTEDATTPVVALTERRDDAPGMTSPQSRAEPKVEVEREDRAVQDEKSGESARQPSRLESTKPVVTPVPQEASDGLKRAKSKTVTSGAPPKKKEIKAKPDLSKDIPTSAVYSKKDVPAIKVVAPEESVSRKQISPKDKELTAHVDRKADISVEGDKGFASTREIDAVQENLESRLKTFLAGYSQAYENRKLDRFETFFAPDAVEDGKPFTQQLPKYRRNFERIDSLSYDIELSNYSVQKDTGRVNLEGTYFARAQVAGGSGEWKQIRGEISMELLQHNDTFRIKRLNSKSQSIADARAKQPVQQKESEQKPARTSKDDLLDRLNTFLTDYSNAYESKQLDKLSAFFTPDATEKGEPFHSLLPKYRRTFGKIDSMDYSIDLKRYSVQEGSGLIRIEGNLKLRVKLIRGSGEWQESISGILMELAAYGDSFKIRRLDY